jgi:biopolymer transport protein ExbD
MFPCRCFQKIKSMAKRAVPEINSSSMADIAFMLLIFFLVATTMDVDSGITRMLPPPMPEDQVETPPIRERNVFVVLVNKNNQLLAGGKPMAMSQLKEASKEFIQNPYRRANLPEFTPTEIDLLGTVDVSKGVISLQNDRGTAYKTYIEVQNELTAAYNEVRDEFSMERFGKKYSLLTAEQADAVRKAIPQRISEAEPKNVGGN